MSKKVLLSLSLILMVVFAFSSIGHATILELAHDTVEPHPVYLWAEDFKELVEDWSNGEIEISIYPAGELGDSAEGVEQAQMGTIDIAQVGTPVVQFCSDYGVFDLPYLFESREHAYGHLWYGEVGEEMSARMLESTGGRLFPLTWFENGWRNITNNVRPINVPGDLDGIRLRVPDSSIRIFSFETFGAAPTPTPWPEVYGALESGLADGQENPIETIYATSFYEVQDYLSITNHLYSLQTILMNKESWDALDAFEQAIIDSAAKKASVNIINYIAEREEGLIEELDDLGMEVNYADMDAFVSVAEEEIWPEYEEDWGDLIEMIRATAD